MLINFEISDLAGKRIGLEGGFQEVGDELEGSLKLICHQTNDNPLLFELSLEQARDLTEMLHTALI